MNEHDGRAHRLRDGGTGCCFLLVFREGKMSRCKSQLEGDHSGFGYSHDEGGRDRRVEMHLVDCCARRHARSQIVDKLMGH